MDLIEILKPETVRVVSGVSSKKRLFQDIAALMGSVHSMDESTVQNALTEREGLGPTGVGRGIALPHARLDNIAQVAGCFLKLEKPIDFEAVDRQPVDLIFALFAPKDSGVEHLKALAAVSRVLKNTETCAKLRGNTEVSTLYAILASEAQTRAA